MTAGTVARLCLAALVLGACGGDGSGTTPAAGPQAAGATRLADLRDAVAVGLATDGDERLVVAWTEDEAVRIVDLDPDTAEVGRPVDVGRGLAPTPSPIERPAVSVGPSGAVHVAFTVHGTDGGTVQYALVDGGRVDGPRAISGPPRPETNLVHMTAAEDRPAMAWLEDSTLSVAAGGDAVAPVEVEGVDDLTCDCCNPVPIRLDEALAVAYRDLERTADGTVRDVAVTVSADGRMFESPTVVADDPWVIEACPFSGPSAVVTGDHLVVAWMDARQSVHPDQDATTIWVDRSADGGRTFGADVAVTEEGIHRWPVVARDPAGVLHMVWETDGDDGGLSYSASGDGGASFSAPSVLVPHTAQSGARRAPSVVVHRDRLVVSWVDDVGGHVASFPLGG